MCNDIVYLLIFQITISAWNLKKKNQVESGGKKFKVEIKCKKRIKFIKNQVSMQGCE